MSTLARLLVPKVNVTTTGRRPTLVEYVETYLNGMRAPLKEKTIFSPAGRGVIHQPGERILLGPKGQKIRVYDTPSGTQVEHGNERGRGVEHLHAHVRPRVVTVGFAAMGGDIDALIKQRERDRVAAGRRIFIPRGRGAA